MIPNYQARDISQCWFVIRSSNGLCSHITAWHKFSQCIFNMVPRVDIGVLWEYADDIIVRTTWGCMYIKRAILWMKFGRSLWSKMICAQLCICVHSCPITAQLTADYWVISFASLKLYNSVWLEQKKAALDICTCKFSTLQWTMFLLINYKW